MASPDTLALRARMDALTPVWTPVETDPTPRTAVRGDFATGLRLSSLNASMRAKRDRILANGPRDIPTSGPGRRRAKAWRNQGLCLNLDGDKRCGKTATDGGRCQRHQPEPAESAA